MPAPVDDLVRAQAVALHREGATYSAIAARIGVHHTTVRRWCQRAQSEGTAELERDGGLVVLEAGTAAREVAGALRLVRDSMATLVELRDDDEDPKLQAWCADKILSHLRHYWDALAEQGASVVDVSRLTDAELLELHEHAEAIQRLQQAAASRR